MRVNEDENAGANNCLLDLKNVYFVKFKFVYKGPTHHCIKFTTTDDSFLFFSVKFQMWPSPQTPE